MSAATSPIRFSSFCYNSLQSILSSLIPMHQHHFLVSSFNPITELLSEKVYNLQSYSSNNKCSRCMVARAAFWMSSVAWCSPRI